MPARRGGKVAKFMSGRLAGARKITEQYQKFTDGRSERIRTSDPLLPKQVRYQAALHSVSLNAGCLPPLGSAVNPKRKCRRYGRSDKVRTLVC